MDTQREKPRSSMADDMEEQERNHHHSSSRTPPPPAAPPPSSSSLLLLRLMSKRRTWVCLFIFVYAILLSSSWNLLRSILSWYKSSSSSSYSSWPALYASVLLGVVFGLLSMAAALAVAVPAMLVTWITIIVLLTCCGKPKGALVVEGRKITKEIAGLVLKILLKEGNVVAAVCAVLGYFALVRRNSEAD